MTDAKTLLLGHICDNCSNFGNYLFTGLGCHSIERAKQEIEIQTIGSDEWSNFHKFGLNIPNDNTCDFFKKKVCFD